MTREERGRELYELTATFGGAYKLGEIYILVLNRAGQEKSEGADQDEMIEEILNHEFSPVLATHPD